jgi:hypothetical protein
LAGFPSGVGCCWCRRGCVGACWACCPCWAGLCLALWVGGFRFCAPPALLRLWLAWGSLPSLGVSRCFWSLPLRRALVGFPPPLFLLAVSSSCVLSSPLPCSPLLLRLLPLLAACWGSCPALLLPLGRSPSPGPSPSSPPCLARPPARRASCWPALRHGTMLPWGARGSAAPGQFQACLSEAAPPAGVSRLQESAPLCLQSQGRRV